MLTYGIKRGEPLILSSAQQIQVAMAIATASQRYQLKILAFNVLPDPVHLVIATLNEAQLREQVRKIKGFSSYSLKPYLEGESGTTVWAQKFHQQHIEDQETLRNALNYVQTNHLKHVERWGKQLITTWETGYPSEQLKAIAHISQTSCITVTDLANSSSLF
jgi:cobyrinic acid a,c-diamide synthase